MLCHPFQIYGADFSADGSRLMICGKSKLCDIYPFFENLDEHIGNKFDGAIPEIAKQVIYCRFSPNQELVALGLPYQALVFQKTEDSTESYSKKFLLAHAHWVSPCCSCKSDLHTYLSTSPLTLSSFLPPPTHAFTVSGSLRGVFSGQQVLDHICQ